MIDVSQTIKSQYRRDEIPHTIRFTIGTTDYTETDLLSGSLSIQESICSQDTLVYNSVESAKLELTLAKETGNIKELTGKELSIYADVSGTSIPLGVFTIKEATLDGDYFTKITAYNRMQIFQDTIIDDWWNEDLTFPLTLKQLLIALCTELDVPYSLPSSWTNSGISITQNAYFDQTKASELLGYIQEVSGAFFVIDRTGTLKMLDSAEETTIFTYELLLNDPEIADYAAPSIERLWVHATDDDVGVTVGTGTNTYTITANPLLYNFGTSELTTIAENILDSIERVGYVPFKATVKCQPYLEVGDPVTVRSYKGNQASFILMSRKMSDVGLVSDEIEVKGDTEIKQRTSTAKQVKVLNRQMHEVVNTVEEFSSTIEEIETDLANSAVGYEYYYLNNTGTRPAANDPNWSSTMTWIDGLHCWKKTVIIHNSGTRTVGSIEDITGATGASGAAGRSITGEKIYYQASQNGTTVPSGTWLDSDENDPPYIASGWFLWTKFVQSFSDNTSLTYYSVVKSGEDGQDGATGPQGPQGPPGDNDSAHYSNAVHATAAIAADRLIVGDANGYREAAAGVAFDISYPLLWSDEAIAQGSNGTENYLSMPSKDLRNNKSAVTLTQWETAYLVGHLSNNTFTIADVVFAEAPSAVDGFVYIPLGTLYTTHEIYFTGGVPTCYSYGTGGFAEYGFNQSLIVSEKFNSELSQYKDSIQSTVERIPVIESNLEELTASQAELLNSLNDDITALASRVTQTESAISSEVLRKNGAEDEYITMAKQMLDEHGLHIQTSNTSTTTNVDGKGFTVTQPDGTIIAQFTTEDSLVNFLKAVGYIAAGSHRAEYGTMKNWAGNTVDATNIFHTGRVV